MAKISRLLDMRWGSHLRRNRYYSQNGEDCLLWDFFGHSTRGYYIDIGAFDGIHLSNTYSFERRGWRGICVEPHPEYFPLLTQNRPRSKCLHYACVKARGVARIAFQREKLGLLSSILDSEAYIEDVNARYIRRGLHFEGFEDVDVPAATVDEILEAHLDPDSRIDFVSIDVEGLELDVLQGFDTERYSPRVIVVEANTGPAAEEIINFLVKSRGFLFAGRLIENLFFVRNRGDLARIRGIEIDCTIEKQRHPLGQAYTIPEFLDGKRVNENGQNRLIWKSGEA